MPEYRFDVPARRRGLSPLLHLWSSNPPTNEGGQASHDNSWVGSITNVFFMKQKIYEQYQCQWGFVTEIS
jgi:hypothetical protein